MLDINAPIGVMDSGIGGYTVLSEIRKHMPHENIIYFGDAANQPYGNLNEEEILFLVRQCLEFLKAKKVKAVAVACNTISSLIDKYQPFYDFKIFSIVQAGSEDVIRMGLSEVGVFSTVFTAQSRCYEKIITKLSPSVKVYAQGSPMLARIIEDANFDQARIRAELKDTLGVLITEHPQLKSLVLGCTHFPLVSDDIKELYPQLTTLINPAATEAQFMLEYLRSKNALKECGEGRLAIYTTGDVETYNKVASSIGIKKPYDVIYTPALITLKNA